MTHAEVIRRIEHEVALIGNRRLACRSFGITPQLLSMVLTGQRGIGPKFLKALRLRKAVTKTVEYKEARRARN
jgi:hypothetical protein